MRHEPAPQVFRDRLDAAHQLAQRLQSYRGQRPLVLAIPRGAAPMARALAQALQGQEGVWALAADTDGIDGVEDNAGARVAPDTLARAAARGVRIGDHLDRNDAYGYFERLGDLVVTGPTHTNVNDFRALLVL